MDTCIVFCKSKRLTQNAQQTWTLSGSTLFVCTLNVEYWMHDDLTDTHSAFSQVNRIAYCSADMLPEVKRVDSKAYIFSQLIFPNRSGRPFLYKFSYPSS